jgi:hypothetical protein
MAKARGGQPCPGCKYPNAHDALACSMCGRVLGREEPAPEAFPSALEPEADAEPAPAPEQPAEDDVRFRPPAEHLRAAVRPVGPTPTWATHLPASLVHLAAGIPAAVALNLVCCGFLGWGMGAPTHEFGHAIFGWLMGYFSIPLPVVTIRLTRSIVVFLIVWGLIAFLVHRVRPPRKVLITLGVITLALWGLALTPQHELLILWGGHGGEVLFAAGFFYLALRGGLDKPYERPIYATLAWSAWFNNVNMFRKLITDPGFQYVYHIQSFLMQDGTNDYSRIATQLDTTVPVAAGFGLFTSLVIPPLGVALYWVGHRHELWEGAVVRPSWMRRPAQV